MNKMLLVLQREYLEIVRTKMFIISTLLTPLFMIAIFLVPMLLAQIRTGRPETIAIVDNTDIGIYEDIKNHIESDEDLKARYNLIKKQANLYEEVEAFSALREKVLGRELDAFIVADRDILKTGNITYYSQNVSNFNTQRLLENTLNSIVVVNRFRLMDIDEIVLAQNLDPIDFQVMRVTKEGETVDKGQGFIISYVFILLIYMTILMYGVTVLRGVIQEKSSRVIEIVISNLRPFDLLMGKVLGIGLVGLTQYLVWLVLGYLITNNMGSISGAFGLSGMMSEAELLEQLKDIPLSVFAYFVIFFILGYFLYSTLYAAIGSMVDNEQEANYIQSPLIMFLVIPMLIIPLVIQNPDSGISVFLSMFPFFSPMLMFLRITVLQPPFYQILLSIIILILTIIFSTYIASKIYRVGILMYGKKPSFKEVMKWISYR